MKDFVEFERFLDESGGNDSIGDTIKSVFGRTLDEKGNPDDPMNDIGAAFVAVMSAARAGFHEELALYHEWLNAQQ